MYNTKEVQFFVQNLLNENLPDCYHYHNLNHTMYVAQKAYEIAKQEICTAVETELAYIAGLWHDTGFIETIKNHEEESCVLVKKYLPDFGFSESQITTICGMIMATKIPQSPKTLMEEILADADMEYLGTDRAKLIAGRLYQELRETTNPDLTEYDWAKIQISFLQKHHYFTRYCIENKEPLKQIYLKSLIDAVS